MAIFFLIFLKITKFSSVFNRIMGTINGEGLPSQQLAKYNADQAEISKFSSWQNEIGVYPAHNSTLSDILNFKSNRHSAKYNTQTVVGKGNFGRVVNCFGGVSNSHVIKLSISI